jgi:hypothetical protein
MPGPKGVEFVALPTHKQSQTAIERHPTAVKAIEKWIAASGFDTAIWAALATNFAKETGRRFSAEAAVRYLESLDRQALANALRYIRNTPPEIRTPVRQLVAGGKRRARG